MSYYLIDFNNSKIDFSFDQIIIGRKIKMDQDNCKYYIYYQTDSNDVPKELYLKLPKLRLIYNLANHKYNQLSIPIYPNWDQTNNFIDWIKTFEKNIIDCFVKKKINKEFISLINKKNLLSFVKANIHDKVKITSDIEDKKINLEDFKINGQIEMVIKISSIWSRGEKMGLSSQIYQIKYYAPPDQLNINFIDPEIPKPNIPLPPPMMVSFFKPNPEEIAMKSLNISNMGNTNSLPPQIGLKIIPSPKDLQNAIKGLKPVNVNNKK
jgi:hypothetical protein